MYSKILKNDQNIPKPKNYQNNPETYKMTKIPPKPENYQNTPKTQVMTKILPNPKK